MHFGQTIFGHEFIDYVLIQFAQVDPLANQHLVKINSDQYINSMSGLGTDRVLKAFNICSCLIYNRHSDAPQIAFWQDRLLETWANLRELVNTRIQLLISTAHRFIYISRCSVSFIIIYFINK